MLSSNDIKKVMTTVIEASGNRGMNIDQCYKLTGEVLKANAIQSLSDGMAKLIKLAEKGMNS